MILCFHVPDMHVLQGSLFISTYLFSGTFRPTATVSTCVPAMFPEKLRYTPAV